MDAEYTIEAVKEKLHNLTNTAEGIQATSFWFKVHRNHAKESVEAWAEEITNIMPTKKVYFLNLCNEIIQTARKHTIDEPDFALEFSKVLEPVFTNTFKFVSDEMKQKVARILKVWRERRVYDPAFIERLFAAAEIKTESANDKPRRHSSSNSNHTRSSVPDPMSAIPPMLAQTVAGLRQLKEMESVTLETITKINGIRSSLYLEDTFQNSRDVEFLQQSQTEVQTAIARINKYIYANEAESRIRQNIINELQAVISEQTSVLSTLARHREDMIEKKTILTRVEHYIDQGINGGPTNHTGVVHPATLDRIGYSWSPSDPTDLQL